MILTDLAAVLRKAGLDVVEQPGWKSRGHGPLTNVHGVTCHHTASGRGKGKTLGLSTVQDGRPGLDGPLAQLYLNREGTFYVVAAGVAYHAGVSLKDDYSNWHRIGIEALAAGDGWSEDWPDTQMEAYAVGCKALADHYGFPVSEVKGHKETCSPPGRKIDPSFSMTNFRSSVGNVDLTEEDDMKPSDRHTLTEADAKAFGDPSLEGETKSYDELWRFPPAVARVRRELDDDIKTVNAKLDAVIAALQASGTAVKVNKPK